MRGQRNAGLDRILTIWEWEDDHTVHHIASVLNLSIPTVKKYLALKRDVERFYL